MFGCGNRQPQWGHWTISQAIVHAVNVAAHAWGIEVLRYEIRVPCQEATALSRERHRNIQWIGLLGKILTGNPWVFTIKLIGLSCKISHHPILWNIGCSQFFLDWNMFGACDHYIFWPWFGVFFGTRWIKTTQNHFARGFPPAKKTRFGLCGFIGAWGYHTTCLHQAGAIMESMETLLTYLVSPKCWRP